jgi:hypothetical protein
MAKGKQNKVAKPATLADKYRALSSSGLNIVDLSPKGLLRISG